MRSDVEKLHNTICEGHGLHTSNRVLSLVKSVFNYAIDHEDLNYDGPSPARRVTKFEEHSRERFLQSHEMRAFFDAADQQPADYRDFFLLLLYTAQRRGNVAAMRWDQLNLRQAEWRIPLTKNGRPHQVPLIEPAIQILLHRKDDGSGWVFPSSDNATGHLTEFKKPWAKLTDAAGLRDLRMHDLRRTMGSCSLTGSGRIDNRLALPQPPPRVLFGEKKSKAEGRIARLPKLLKQKDTGGWHRGRCRIRQENAMLTRLSHSSNNVASRLIAPAKPPAEMQKQIAELRRENARLRKLVDRMQPSTSKPKQRQLREARDESAWRAVRFSELPPGSCRIRGGSINIG